jgi:hypothetical protein
MRIDRDVVRAVGEIERGSGFEVRHEERVLVMLPRASDIREREDPRDHTVVARQTFVG